MRLPYTVGVAQTPKAGRVERKPGQVDCPAGSHRHQGSTPGSPPRTDSLGFGLILHTVLANPNVLSVRDRQYSTAASSAATERMQACLQRHPRIEPWPPCAPGALAQPPWSLVVAVVVPGRLGRRAPRQLAQALRVVQHQVVEDRQTDLLQSRALRDLGSRAQRFQGRVSK